MKSTERLIDSSNNRLARDLLRSADLDEAPNNTVAKVALALGLGSTALVATVTTGAAASTGSIAGTGVAAGTSAIAGTGVAAGVGTAAAVPAAGAVTAISMLKVMAIVGLTCGTLSYGSVKLALKVTDKPAVTNVESARRVAPSVVAQAAVAQTVVSPRSVAAFGPAVDLPAPPPPRADSDLGTAARGQEPPAVAEVAAPRESNAPALGRQSIQAKSAEPIAVAQRAETLRAVGSPASQPPALPVTAGHTAAFPGDDAHQAANEAAANPRNDPSKSASDLEREVALLDHARAALAAGQPAQALRELDAYRQQTPRGMLAAESVVLRVKALLAMGQRSAAEREANPLLMSAPQSRHAGRLRELLGAPGVAP